MKFYLAFFLISHFFITHSQDTLNVYFQNNSAYIGKTNRQVLLNELKSVTIHEIHGYTDINGTKVHNNILSKKRTDATYNFIKKIKTADLNKCEIYSHGKVKSASKHYFKDRISTIIYSKKENSIYDKIKDSKKGDNIELKNLNFVGGQAILLSESESILIELLEIMNKNKKLKIRIEGHICCNFIDEENLSEQRAKTIFDYLSSNGIQTNRMNAIGHGANKPKFALPEKNEFERKSNRRVEITIIDK